MENIREYGTLQIDDEKSGKHFFVISIIEKIHLYDLKSGTFSGLKANSTDSVHKKIMYKRVFPFLSIFPINIINRHA